MRPALTLTRFQASSGFSLRSRNSSDAKDLVAFFRWTLAADPQTFAGASVTPRRPGNSPRAFCSKLQGFTEPARLTPLYNRGTPGMATMPAIRSSS